MLDVRCLKCAYFQPIESSKRQTLAPNHEVWSNRSSPTLECFELFGIQAGLTQNAAQRSSGDLTML